MTTEEVKQLLDTTQTHLTLTQAALSAAVELLELSSYPTEHDSPYCYHCPTTADDDPDVHADDCPYRQAEARWDAAREALEKAR